MHCFHETNSPNKPWNKGKLIGQKTTSGRCKIRPLLVILFLIFFDRASLDNFRSGSAAAYWRANF